MYVNEVMGRVGALPLRLTRSAKSIARRRLTYIAGLSLIAFRLSFNSADIGRFKFTPFGGIGDINHLV